MERERINRESVSRTIQQKNNFGGAYMVDNRSDKNLNYLSDSPLQRVGDEDEETLQGKLDSPLQRVEDEDDTLQGKFDGTLQKKNETGMPDNLKAGIESLSGFSMDDVRVHYNSSKPATVQALAYTQGTDIHVAPSQEKCLPHEAWHVAQQMAGRVSPTTNINGMPVNDNAALEHEADVMGEKAVQCKNENKIVKLTQRSDSRTFPFQLTRTLKEKMIQNSVHSLKMKISEAIQGKKKDLALMLTGIDVYKKEKEAFPGLKTIELNSNATLKAIIIINAAIANKLSDEFIKKLYPKIAVAPKINPILPIAFIQKLVPDADPKIAQEVANEFSKIECNEINCDDAKFFADYTKEKYKFVTGFLNGGKIYKDKSYENMTSSELSIGRITYEGLLRRWNNMPKYLGDTVYRVIYKDSGEDVDSIRKNNPSSTSVALDINRTEDEAKVIRKIKIKNSAEDVMKPVDMRLFSFYTHESEILLPPNTIFTRTKAGPRTKGMPIEDEVDATLPKVTN